MIGWLIALGILLLLAVLLLMPFVFRVEYDDPNDNFFWKLSWFGGSLIDSEGTGLFQRMKRRPKKPKPDDKPEKSKKPEKEKGKHYWQMFRDATSTMPRVLRWLWKGISIHKVLIAVQVGCFDAKACAISYGAVNAAIYAALGLLQSTMRIKKPQVVVRCAFGTEKFQWVIRGRMHFCLLSAIFALSSFALGYVMHRGKNDAESEPEIQKQTTRPVTEPVGK